MRPSLRALAILLVLGTIVLIAGRADDPEDAQAGIIAGQYSLEVAVNETSVALGATFIAHFGVYHNEPAYRAIQFVVDYDPAVVDATTIATDAAMTGQCSSVSEDINAQLLLGCVNFSGPNITRSGEVFRVAFTCIANGSVSLAPSTGNPPSFVSANATTLLPIHTHGDTVQCGAGGGPTPTPPPPPPPPTPAPGQESCMVQEVLTGDSFVCAGGRRVRMLQIDAQDPGQCGGGWAKAALANIFLPVGRQVTLDFDDDRTNAAGDSLAAPIARGTDGADYNLSIVMVYVGLAQAADFGDGNTKYLSWANASQVWASVAKWNMWAPGKTYTGGCD